MSFNPFSWVKSEVVAGVHAIVPQEILNEVGTLGHAWALNMQHDVKKMGVALKPVATQAMLDIWTAVKASVSSALSDPKLLEAVHEDKINAAFAVLTSDAAKSLVPALQDIGKTTLKAMATTAGQMIISGVSGNPTLAVASSSGASSQASSSDSTTASHPANTNIPPVSTVGVHGAAKVE